MAERALSNYESRIQGRSYSHYLKGLLVRWKQHLVHEWAVRIARKNGATVGQGVVMPMRLARKANANLVIGDYVAIQTDRIDLRSPVTIGSNVIIGIDSEIITTSHDIDSEFWQVKHYGVVIEDYAWIPTRVLILPSCRRIGYGAVVGSGSVVARDVELMSVVVGNPAAELRKRAAVHSALPVESLLGGDYRIYKEAWKKRKK